MEFLRLEPMGYPHTHTHLSAPMANPHTLSGGLSDLIPSPYPYGLSKALRHAYTALRAPVRITTPPTTPKPSTLHNQVTTRNCIYMHN